MNTSSSEYNLRDFDLVFVDLEMTGLDLSKEIIEIGFVKAKAKTFEVLTEKDIKIKPVAIEQADPEALLVNGYDPAEWEHEGVSVEEGISEFLKHTENAMLVGHNLLIDWMFLQKTIESAGKKPNYFYKGLDTVSLAWAVLQNEPEIKKFSLEELSRHFGIDEGRKHRAIDDARTTYQAFLKLVEYAKRETL